MSHEAIVGGDSSRDGGDSGIGGVYSGGGIGGGSSDSVNCGGNHGVSGGVDRGASSVVMISPGSGNSGLVNWNTKSVVF